MIKESFSILNDKRITDSYKSDINWFGLEKFQIQVESSLSGQDYNKVWFTLTESLNNVQVGVLGVKKMVKFIFEKKYENIKKSDGLINFLDGMAYFLTNQKSFNTQEITGLLNGFENSLFIETFKNKQTHHTELFSKYKTSDRYQLYKEAISVFMQKKDREIVKEVLPYMTGLNTNNCEVLRVFYNNNFYYYDIVKDTIDKFKLDINVVGTTGVVDKTDDSQRKWAFTHAVFSDNSMQGKSFFNDFIKDFGKEIDFNSLFSYIHRGIHNEGTWKHKNVLKMLWESSVPLNEVLNRTDAVLKNCTINEKILAQISKYIFSSNIVAAYGHEVYDTFFKTEVFRSSAFDKGSLVNVILNLDKDLVVIASIEESKGVVNPVTLILDKLFVTYPSAKPEVHPFISWATDNKKFSKDTFNYLFTKYSSEIKQLPLEQLNELPSSIKGELTSRGVAGLQEKGLFSRFWSKPQVVATAEVAPAPVFTPHQSELSFSEKLFERVSDADIKYYIESIKLNAEQFEAVFDGAIISKNTHYMLNLLPKFLNKTVENYLTFQAIDPEEAKENTLVQLKLLNKKSVDILNEGLIDEKDKVLTKAKVNTNIINQY